MYSTEEGSEFSDESTPMIMKYKAILEPSCFDNAVFWVKSKFCCKFPFIRPIELVI